MRKLNIKIEDGIKQHEIRRNNMLDNNTRELLKNIKVGQSFTVKTVSEKLTVQNYGRHIGKKFSSRKIYDGTTKGINAPHHFRLWCDSEKPKPLLEKKYEAKHIVKNFGSLTKGNVSEGEGDATTRHKVSNDVLAMAELRADNKRIVEDIERIKKILKEELGHSLEEYRPLNEDASN
tara:strand:- start:87 stop:617 length:531 start_codon:yes stop_codon:yes gene_type:complete